MMIAVYGSRRQEKAAPIIADFLVKLRELGIGVEMHWKLYDHLAYLVPAALEGVSRCAADVAPTAPDLAVSLGGDGTFLRTLVWLNDICVPVVGVNTGHLGYLTALCIDELPQLPQLILDDAFAVEHRSVLDVTAPQLPDSVGAKALNEVAIAKEESASMIKARVYLDDKFLAEYSADGLIVSTSTGSTAYNLSVGGPIVAPSLDVRIISPVAAHSLSMRPMVVPGTSAITIIPESRSPHVRLALDGRSVLLDAGTPVEIAPATNTVDILQLRDQSFADTLRRKLHWGD